MQSSIQNVQSKKQILAVDDSEDMRFLLEQMLEEEGYQVRLAEDGSTALNQAEQYHPDLILMDMSLPGMSGWEAVVQLRRLAAFQHTPIIAVTAHVSAAATERALAIGCNAHLGKPFDVAQVLDTIAALLNVQEV